MDWASQPLWRAVLKRRGSVERIHSLSGFNCVDGKKSKTSRRMPIVLGTFTSSSTKFVDLSYHAWTL